MLTKNFRAYDHAFIGAATWYTDRATVNASLYRDRDGNIYDIIVYITPKSGISEIYRLHGPLNSVLSEVRTYGASDKEIRYFRGVDSLLNIPEEGVQNAG